MKKTKVGKSAQRRPRRGSVRPRKVDLILNAARLIFLRHGYGEATTDLIQATAGVSKSTLYAHFSTKKDLFEAVCDTKWHYFEKLLQEAVGNERRPRQYLQRFGTTFISHLLAPDNLAFYRLMVTGARRFPDLGQTLYVRTGVKASADMVENYLRDAHASRLLNVPNPALSAEHYLGMLRGELFTRAILNAEKIPGPSGLRKRVAITVDHFLAAHGTERGVLRRPASCVPATRICARF
jgi:TetR/AcrR family transcriptional regulator, mexJK operon transcriptional repressor